MPSLVIAGHPCTLKTSFCRLLTQRALAHPSAHLTRAVHISESTALSDYSKSQCYQNSSSEKLVRAALKSAFDRAVTDGSETTLVVLDSLNYIKGFRYELYCISKAAGERHGVIWIRGDDELAKERNRRRKKQWHDEPALGASDTDDGYYVDDATMDELVRRFEPPDERNRWENPLFVVDMSRVLPWDQNGTLPQTTSVEMDNDSPSMQPSSSGETHDETQTPAQPLRSAAGFKRNKKCKPRLMPQSTNTPSPGMDKQASSSPIVSMASRNLATRSSLSHNAATDNDVRTIEQVVDDILTSFFLRTPPLKEGLSTIVHSSAESNVLNLVDVTSLRINHEIVRAQSAAGDGGRIVISLTGSHAERVMVLKQPLSVHELRNVRQRYLKWMASHPLVEGAEEEHVVAENYVKYIESQL